MDCCQNRLQKELKHFWRKIKMTNKEKYLNAFTETFEITAEETRGGGT